MGDARESDALLGGDPTPETTPEDVFAEFDTDGSGSLSLQEVRAALTRLNLPVDERVDRLFRALDTDGNGSLNFEEFASVCKDMDPGKISAESVAREIDRQANFLEKLGTTVADGFTTSAGTSSLSEGTCTCMGVSAVVQFICHYGINLGICAYAIYVGFKFKADPSAVCRTDALWMII